MRQSSMTSSPLPLTGDRKAGQERAPLTAWWFHSERRRMRRQSTSKFISAVLFSSAVGATLGSSPARTGPVYAAEIAKVAFVEDVSGHVVAFSQGKPSLIGALDTIRDRTQVDLLPNSELRICHYQTRQVVTLEGPVRASILRDSVAIENGKAVLAFAESCSARSDDQRLRATSFVGTATMPRALSPVGVPITRNSGNAVVAAQRSEHSGMTTVGKNRIMIYGPKDQDSKRDNKYLRTLFVWAPHVVLARRPSAALRSRRS
jgi:hypothetical protein